MSDAESPSVGDDPEVVMGVAALYFRAAACLSEASVLVRLCGSCVDDEGRIDDEGFVRLARAAAGALEGAAAEHERAAALLRRARFATAPGMPEHVESIRIAVRALNHEAVRLAMWADDGDGTGEEADEGLGEAGPEWCSPREMLLERADTFADKAWLMAESARAVLGHAHVLARAA